MCHAVRLIAADRNINTRDTGIPKGLAENLAEMHALLAGVCVGAGLLGALGHKRSRYA